MGSNVFSHNMLSVTVALSGSDVYIEHPERGRKRLVLTEKDGRAVLLEQPHTELSLVWNVGEATLHTLVLSHSLSPPLINTHTH